MIIAPKFLVRIFSPRVISKVLASLDKSTAIVISACWLAALVMLILAVFAVHGAVSSKREAAAAIAVEPALPVVASTPMSLHEIQVVIERLQHQFPDIKIDTRPGEKPMLTIKSDEGIKFHQWVNALSYIDTMSPQYRWTLREFCVGDTCGNGRGLMSASVSGEKVVFSMPQP
jgi:hypothetical protein